MYLDFEILSLINVLFDKKILYFIFDNYFYLIIAKSLLICTFCTNISKDIDIEIRFKINLKQITILHTYFIHSGTYICIIYK